MNIIILSYIATLGLKICLITIKDQKIDSYFFWIHSIIIINFVIIDKFNKAWYSQNTYLLADIRIKIVFKCKYKIYSQITQSKNLYYQKNSFNNLASKDYK